MAMIAVGTASSIIPVVYIMSKIGRRRTFLGVCVYTIAVIALAIMALELKSFYLFCLSTFLFGVTAATMNQFRFAAIESVDENLSATATSAVLIGGFGLCFFRSRACNFGKRLV